MASNTLKQITRSPTLWSYEKEVGLLHVKFIVGATGSVASFKGADVKSVVRNSAGNYTITLNHTYQRLMMAQGTVSSATAKNLGFQVIGNPANTQATFKSTGSVTVQFTDGTGTPADPSSGDHVWVKLEVRFSPVAVYD